MYVAITCINCKLNNKKKRFEIETIIKSFGVGKDPSFLLSERLTRLIYLECIFQGTYFKHREMSQVIKLCCLPTLSPAHPYAIYTFIFNWN